MAIPTAYEFDVNDLIMSTAAYYLGRQTINVDDFCTRLCRSWSMLSIGVQEYIQRIVEDAFNRESRAGPVNVFGSDCDRESWRRVRRCWMSEDGQHILMVPKRFTN